MICVKLVEHVTSLALVLPRVRREPRSEVDVWVDEG